MYNEIRFYIMKQFGGMSMILDKMNNYEVYEGAWKGFKEAFDFLKQNDLNSLQEGKYPILGDQVYASVKEYETKPVEEGKYEAHRRYIDLQCIISGSEIIGYAPIDELKEVEEYNQERDRFFLQGEGDFFTFEKGQFAIFFPQDGHMTGVEKVGKEKVKKLIIKIQL